MAKKSEQVTVHMTEDLLTQLTAMANAEGYDKVSLYMHDIAQSNAQKQQEVMKTLAPAFGYSQNSNDSDSPQREFAQLMRTVTPMIAH